MCFSCRVVVWWCVLVLERLYGAVIVSCGGRKISSFIRALVNLSKSNFSLSGISNKPKGRARWQGLATQGQKAVRMEHRRRQGCRGSCRCLSGGRVACVVAGGMVSSVVASAVVVVVAVVDRGRCC